MYNYNGKNKYLMTKGLQTLQKREKVVERHIWINILSWCPLQLLLTILDE